MRMELIQPFINAADAVSSRNRFRRRRRSSIFRWTKRPIAAKALPRSFSSKATSKAASILDFAPEVALKIASHLAGGAVQESEQIARETVCELANMVIGNSVTLLNDQGFRFKVFPPEIHVNEARPCRRRRYRSHGHLHRNAVRRGLSQHLHALSAPSPQRARCRRSPRLTADHNRLDLHIHPLTSRGFA